MTADATTPRRSSRNPLAYAFAKHRSEGTVTEVAQVTPRMRRIRIATDRPVPPTYVPGQHVRIEINDPLSLYGILRPAETLRSYTVWESAEREFELRVHLHGDGDGIGLRWARSVTPGDRVAYWGPMGHLGPRPGRYHLFVGEETATVAFWPIIRALGRGERVHAVLESETAQDEPPVPAVHELVRVHRRGASAASSARLVAAVAGLDLPAEPGVAYVAGEARTGQLVRNHLTRERGWPRSAVTVTPFWTPGKRGLH